MHHATPSEMGQYEERGFFTREGVFAEDEVDDLRQAAEHVHKQILDAAADDEAPAIDRVDNQRFQVLRGSSVKWEWRDDLRAVRSMEPAHHLDPRFDALIDDPRDLVHGSQSNRSHAARRVFVLAYQPAGLHRWRLDEQRPVRTS